MSGSRAVETAENADHPTAAFTAVPKAPPAVSHGVRGSPAEGWRASALIEGDRRHVEVCLASSGSRPSYGPVPMDES